MHVLHAIPSLAPRHGGPTEAAFGMVRALRGEGVDARLLSSDDDGGDVLRVPLRRWIEHNGMPCLFLPRARTRHRTLASYTYTPEYAVWLAQNVRDFDFLHVHSIFSHTSIAAMASARQQGVPACVRPLGQLCRWSLTQSAVVKRLHLLLQARRNIDGVRFIHCTSRMEAEETALLGFKAPCEVLPHGLDLPPVVPDARESLRARLGLPADRFLLAYMSRLHPKKGLELLLEACARISTPVDVVIAGGGEPAYVASLHERVRQAGLGGSVHWFGHVAGDRKWQLLQGADAFVLASHSENFAISVLEAMACGLPVIVSDQVALEDEVRTAGTGSVVQLDAPALAMAIEVMRSNVEDRAAMGARAAALVRDRFTWKAMARRLIHAYEREIGDRDKLR